MNSRSLSHVVGAEHGELHLLYCCKFVVLCSVLAVPLSRADAVVRPALETSAVGAACH